MLLLECVVEEGIESRGLDAGRLLRGVERGVESGRDAAVQSWMSSDGCSGHNSIDRVEQRQSGGKLLRK